MPAFLFIAKMKKGHPPLMRWILAIIVLSCVATGGYATAANDTAPEQTSPQTQTQAQSQTTTENEPQLVEANVDTILAQVRKSLNSLNYEAAFIQVRGKFAEPFEWAHGLVEGNEIEYLRSQSGPNLEVVRKGDVVAYFEAEAEPYAVKSRAIQSILPALFFDQSITLGDYYSIAVGGKSRIIDRGAQLIRIVAKDNFRFNYWLWLDIQSGLILKSALVSKQGEVLEQFQITRLNLLPQAPAIAQKLSTTVLPVPPKSAKPIRTSNTVIKPKWKINWLPQGFKVVSRNQHKLSLTREVADYILLTDGLVELSVFIQPPLGNKIKVGHLRSGSNVVAVYHGNGFDVSVVGKVPAQTAERVAQSVSRG